MSGKKSIKPASKAAEEACDQMGKRKFLQIMVQDTMCQERYKITDEMDITTLKDYMQVCTIKLKLIIFYFTAGRKFSLV